MKPFEEVMCRSCSEYEYNDDCIECELSFYKKEYKRLIKTLKTILLDCNSLYPSIGLIKKISMEAIKEAGE